MFAALRRYVSERNGATGIDAYMDDMLVLDPRWFLAQFVKLEPKSISLDTTKRSLQVVMLVDERDNPKRIASDAHAAVIDAPSAT